MRTITEFSLSTGEVQRVVTIPGTHVFTPMDGCGFIEGAYDDSLYIIENGQPVAKPQNPVEINSPSLPPDVQNDVTNFRLMRNALLAASDWTQLPDAPVDRAAWAAYRQALRDLPENTTNLRDPVWPKPPSS